MEHSATFGWRRRVGLSKATGRLSSSLSSLCSTLPEGVLRHSPSGRVGLKGRRGYQHLLVFNLPLA